VVEAAAAVVMVLGYCLSTWAMLENKYFSVVARIQKDRGHTTVMTGPYRFVRHPAYAGGVVYSLAGTLLLGSLWALIPAGLTVVLLAVRTALEDRMLLEGLPGYSEYAHKTLYRLVPGIW
jgi:protein-S-isoprenylcysteine O-methyltransferase Ste14